MQKHNVEFNILTTVNAANADHPLELYRFLRDDLGARYIQFIPIVERATPELINIANKGWGEKHKVRPLYVQAGNLVTDRSVGSEQWGRFLIAIFDEWVRRDVGTVFVQMFDAALASWVGAPAALCIFSETCGTAVALEHNGDVYSCDHYVEPDYLLGNIAQTPLVQLVGLGKQVKFGNDKRDTLPRYCREWDAMNLSEMQDIAKVIRGTGPDSRTASPEGGQICRLIRGSAMPQSDHTQERPVLAF